MSTPAEMASAAQALAAALLAAATSQGDALRLLKDLADFHPADPTSTAAIGESMAEMQSACGDLFRRAAVVALARASADYEPTSYDDAANVRSLVCSLLDAEIIRAGDQGEDASYNALRALRVAVAQDLTERGASLARIAEVDIPAPQPALTLAHRLYRDPARADDLISRGGPVHPAFMPTRFKALSE